MLLNESPFLMTYSCVVGTGTGTGSGTGTGTVFDVTTPPVTALVSNAGTFVSVIGTGG